MTDSFLPHVTGPVRMGEDVILCLDPRAAVSIREWMIL